MDDATGRPQRSGGGDPDVKREAREEPRKPDDAMERKSLEQGLEESFPAPIRST